MCRGTDGLGIGLVRQGLFRSQAKAPFAELVRSQQHGARGRAKRGGQAARQGGFARALQPAHRNQPRGCWRQIGSGGAEQRPPLPPARRLDMRTHQGAERKPERQKP